MLIKIRSKKDTYNTKKQYSYNSFNSSRKKKTAWNAKINSSAYTERTIYHSKMTGCII